MALADFQELIDDLARDPSGAVSDQARDRALDLAVVKYSSDKPRAVKDDVQGDGSALVAMPATFDPDFGAVLDVEYVQSNGVGAPLDNQDWTLYQGVADWYLKFAASVSAAETHRVAFTAKHEVTIDQDTIPITDREAVCHWATGLLLFQLSTEYAGKRQSTLQVDTVDHGSKSRDYAARAKDARKRYYDLLNIDPTRIEAAGIVVDWDGSGSQGQDRLIHTRRHR